MTYLRLCIVIVLVSYAVAAEDAAAAAATLWKDKVQPLLAARCYDCHGQKKAKHDLRLDTKEGILKGGKELGATVIANKPDQSPLLKLCRLAADEEDAMPPKGDRLTKEQLGWISAWIAGGAPMPEAEKKKDDAQKPQVTEPKK